MVFATEILSQIIFWFLEVYMSFIRAIITFNQIKRLSKSQTSMFPSLAIKAQLTIALSRRQITKCGHIPVLLLSLLLKYSLISNTRKLDLLKPLLIYFQRSCRYVERRSSIIHYVVWVPTFPRRKVTNLGQT